MTRGYMAEIQLRKQYENIANAYLKAFCEKHNFDYEDARRSWVADEPGGVCLISDYYVTYDDMRLDIDRDVPEDEYWDYYNYSVQAAEYGFTCPNYSSWLEGCPRMSYKQLKVIYEAHKRMEDAKAVFLRILKEEEKKIGYKKDDGSFGF